MNQKPFSEVHIYSKLFINMLWEKKQLCSTVNTSFCSVIVLCYTAKQCMMFEHGALAVLFKCLSYFLTNSPFCFSFWLRPLDVTARKTVKNLQGLHACMLINLRKPPGGGVLWVKHAIPSRVWLSAFHSPIL